MNYEVAKKLKDAKGEKNNRWKGDKAGYQSKHQFLKRNYGNPKMCEFCNVTGYKEKGGRWSIHWALRKGKEYTHNLEDYMGLCRKCHGKYDWNESKREYVIKGGKATKGIKSKTKKLIAKSKKRNDSGKFTK